MPRLIFGPQIFQIGIIPPLSLELMVKLVILQQKVANHTDGELQKQYFLQLRYLLLF